MLFLFIFAILLADGNIYRFGNKITSFSTMFICYLKGCVCMLLLTYYGHSAFALSDGKDKLLFDPFFSGNPLATTTADVVTCNYILVSHGHADHLGDAPAIAARTGAMVIGTPEILETCRAENGHGMNIGGSAKFSFGSVYMTWAIHSSGVPGLLSCGFVVNIAGKNVYFAGDTALFSDMELIGKRFKLDCALLPIGDNYTMGVEDAAYAVKLLQPKHVIPVHYNTWPVIAAEPERFKELVEKDTDSQVHILAPGDALDMDKL